MPDKPRTALTLKFPTDACRKIQLLATWLEVPIDDLDALAEMLTRIVSEKLGEARKDKAP